MSVGLNQDLRRAGLAGETRTTAGGILADLLGSAAPTSSHVQAGPDTQSPIHSEMIHTEMTTQTQMGGQMKMRKQRQMYPEERERQGEREREREREMGMGESPVKRDSEGKREGLTGAQAREVSTLFVDYVYVCMHACMCVYVSICMPIL